MAPPGGDANDVDVDDPILDDDDDATGSGERCGALPPALLYDLLSNSMLG